MGVIIFQPPTVGKIGHYIAAIKVNNLFIVYDDLRSKTYNLSANESVAIHVLFYVQK